MTADRPKARVRRLLGRVRRLGRPQPPPAPAPDGLLPLLLAEIDRLAGAAPARVAVLHGDRIPPWTGTLADGGASVTLVHAALPAEQRHVELTAAGPFDLVVDTVPRPKRRGGRFVGAFFRLRAGGAYVVRGGADELGPDAQSLGALLERVDAARAAPPARPTQRERDALELARAIESVRAEGRHLVVVNGAGDALPKLRELQLDELVVRRADLPVRTLRVIEGETFASRCAFREVGSRVGPPPPTEYHAPAVPLREYRDALVLPGQVVSVGGLLTPDTFRHHLQRRLRNRHLTDEAPLFARLPNGTGEPVRLPGSYFHLDNEERGHYGHLMTEQLSRVWAWEESKAADPDLRALVGTNWRPEIQPYEYTIYAAAGIAAEDLVLIDGPVRVDRLVAPAPLLSNPEFVHPRIRETWARVGDRLAAGAADGPRPPRIFCSRRLSKRSCRNTPEVEELFREAGFAVIYPEDLPIPDQVATFRSAEVIAGFAGSGLFNLCFVDEPIRVITLRSESYVAQNEYLIAALLGHSIDSVVSVPDNRRFQSPFVFDLDREGRDLTRILAELPD